jgi:glutamyl-tRNA reductase
VAVELAERIFTKLTERDVMVIGAGDTGEKTARALLSRGARSILVSNRSYEKAVALAAELGGRAVDFANWAGEFARVDIIVSSTAAPHYVLDRAKLEPLMKLRRNRPLLLIDIAVPRDIEPACREIPGVNVHDIDDVQQIVERNTSGREAEARRAELIIEAELDRFNRWLASLEVVPTIAALRERGDEVARRVMAENEARWQDLGEGDRERIEAMAKAIASRLLHEPTVRLRRAAGNDDAYNYVSALRELFGLDVETEPEADGEGTVTELPRRNPGRGSA